jgi:hypothetical protein
MNLLISLRSEMLKSKRTASWYFTIISAVLIPCLFALTIGLDAHSPQNMKNPLKAIYMEEFKSLNLLVLPMFVILICTLLPQIEYRNNTWKQVFTSPQTMMQVYLSKFLHVQLLILLFLVVFFISTAVSTVVINFIHPAVKLFDYSMEWGLVVMYIVKTYLCIIAVSVVQFITGLKAKGFIAPIAIGFILWVMGNLLIFEMHSSCANVFPYSFSTMVMFSKYEDVMPLVQSNSCGLGCLFLVAGYFIFAKTNT